MKRIITFICFVFMLVALGVTVSACNTDTHDHTFSESWSTDNTYHWHTATCEHSDKIASKGKHDFKNNVCSICGLQKGAHVHTLEKKQAYKASCTNAGNIEYWNCKICGKKFADDKGKTEISADDVVIEPTGHSFDKAWTIDDVYHWHAATCSHSSQVKDKSAHVYKDGKCLICDDEYQATDGLLYKLNEDGKSYSVVGKGDAFETNVIIPKVYRGKPVTAIAEKAFSGWENLKSIQISDTVTSIGSEAFSDCYGLVTVTIGSSVTSIGNYAFANCIHLLEVYNKSALDIVKGSTDNGYIGYYAYNIYTPTEGESKLIIQNDYVFLNDETPRLVTYLGSDTELILPYSFYGDDYEINDDAFAFQNVTKITIGSHVTKIGAYAFSSCYYLENITIPDGVTSIGERAFVDCYSLKSITIPNSVKSIGDFIFYNCYYLKSAIIPDGITSIGEGAFANCESLESITIPDSVISIREGAFYGCSSLESITIPDSVTSLGNGAFTYCLNLQTVIIGSKVDSIGMMAFQYCFDLSLVYYKKSAADWAQIDISTENNYLLAATRYYYSASMPSEQQWTESDNWWHYDGDVPTAWERN